MSSLMVLLAGATWVSYRQPAPPQFEPAPVFGSVKWWVKPFEQNVALRPPVTSANLQSVAFATPQSGWAVGQRGTILHTEDGGASWKPQSRGTASDLCSVAFVTPQSAWAVGEYGTILHTEDGGGSWKPQNSNTTVSLYSVAFAMPQAGWAVGQGGTILHTEDGGGSWKPQNSGTNASLHSVAFATPQSGWVAGSRGTILHTEDGGGPVGSRRTAVPPPASIPLLLPRRSWAGRWASTHHPAH